MAFLRRLSLRLSLVNWTLAAVFTAACLLFGVEVASPEITRWAALHLFAMAALFLGWRGFSLPVKTLWGIGFFAWAGLSLLWSEDWRGGAVELTNGAGLLAVFLVVACADRAALLKVAGYTVPVIAALAAGLCITFPQWYGGFGNENFQFEFLAALLPLLVLSRSRVAALVVGAVVLYLLASTGSNMKWLVSGALGLACLGFVYRFGYKWGAWIIGTGALVVALAAGVFSADMLKSTAARVEIAVNTVYMWLDSPVWGHGLGSFNILYPLYQERHFALVPQLGSVFGADMSYIAGAAHNEYVQILADYGLIGAIIAGGLGWSLIRWRDRLDSAALVSLFIIAVVSLVEFPLQNPATAALAAFSAGVLVNATKSIKVPRFSVFALTPAVAAVAVVGVLTFQSYRVFAITQQYVGDDPYNGVLANFAAYQTFGWPRSIRGQLAASLTSAIDRDHESIRIEPDAADFVYRLSAGASGRATSVELGRIEYLLLSGRWQERFDEIEGRLAWLKTNASTHAAVWLVEGKWALIVGDKDRALNAVAHARQLPSHLLNYQSYVDTLMAAIQ